MEPSKELSLEEVEEINRGCVDNAALDIENFKKGVVIPKEDIQLFAEHSKGKKMLDVGCGWAEYVGHFIELGFEYTGIDFSPNMIQISRQKHPKLRFELMSFRKLDFPDDTFDSIWCSCVLNTEPKRNIKNVLTEMKRVVRPGGIMLITLPDRGYSAEGFVEIDFPTYGNPYRSDWDPYELKEVMDESDTTVITWFCRYESGSMTFLVQK